MNQPLVSIVVPFYNTEKYLSSCIDSIIGQSYRNIEVILIDDGSIDSSLAICQAYAEHDCRLLVIHQENAGVSVARNIGLESARGEYIMFVDSDDELLEDCVALLVGDIMTYNADIAAASKLFVAADQNENIQCHEDNGAITVFSGTDTLQLSLDFDRRMTACHGKLFRNQFLNDIRYIEGRKINEDFYFIFQCCVKQPIFTYRDECVYKYFYRKNSASRTLFSDKYYDIIYFAEQKKRTIESYYPELVNKAICMEVSSHLFFLNMLCKTSDKKYRKDEKSSIRFVRQNYKKYTTCHAFEKRMSKIVYYGLFPIYKYMLKLKWKIKN